ncbi:hypothetical protein [Pseudomonas baetica]|uniref:hypothetical protein n=1 Tax=Pseudomonas baetica TaxID=674054 RepID=UPI0024049D6B|nr:hypothetical protein [Pseudomonas baetica]MDF9774729.1 hypothetical protein [Pseudomonas baetica]
MKRTPPLPYFKNSNSNLITIISEHHAWRTLSGVQTNDYYAYRKALLNGCHLQKASFELRHPEVMIYDLSNIEPNFNYLSDEEIVNTWSYLNLRTSQLNSSELRKIKGDGLSPEIAISGPSKHLLLEYKNSLIREALSNFSHNRQFSSMKPTIRGIAKNRLLIATNDETIDFHNRFCEFYSGYISHEHWDSSLALNTRYIYEHHAIWHKIKTIAKNKIFLLSAGLPLALGYLATTGDRNIFFSEIHRQNDPSLLTRDNDFLDIFPLTSSSNEPWLIIDKAYTGGSLRAAANMLRKKLGYELDVKTLALFPKTFSAFMSADYAVYAGKLYEVRSHASRLDRENWHTQLITEQPI